MFKKRYFFDVAGLNSNGGYKIHSKIEIDGDNYSGVVNGGDSRDNFFIDAGFFKLSFLYKIS